jgi:hypothetical protein
MCGVLTFIFHEQDLPSNGTKTVGTISTHSELVIRLAYLFKELHHLILSNFTYLVIPKRAQSPFVNVSNVKARISWPGYMVFGFW